MVGRADPGAPRKRVSAAERRARILEVARSTFLERGEGINGVSMRLVAERSGIDEALIYRHFGTKENLYSEVVIAEVGLAVERLMERTRALTVGELSAERERREWQLTYEFVLTLIEMPPAVLRAMGSPLCGDRSRGADFYRSALAPAVRSVEAVVEGELRNWAHPPFSPPLAVRVTIATCLWHVFERDLASEQEASAEPGDERAHWPSGSSGGVDERAHWPSGSSGGVDEQARSPSGPLASTGSSPDFARELTDLIFYGITRTSAKSS